MFLKLWSQCEIQSQYYQCENVSVLKSQSIRSSAMTSCISQIGFSNVYCTKCELAITSNHVLIESGPHLRNMLSLTDFWHTGIPGLWTQELDAELWTLSLTVVEQNQNPVSGFAWLNYWKFFGCKSLRTMVTLVL